MEAFLQGGFAVAVAAFMLLRMEKRLNKLIKAIVLLRHCQTCKLSPWFGELESFVQEGAADEVQG